MNITIDGVTFEMFKQNGSDLNYVDGCIYSYNTTLIIGNHSYFFLTSDGNDSLRLPTIANFTGPYVNSPPNLTLGSVSPLNGTTATVFTFTVNYSDVDNNEPLFIQVVINGSQYEMLKQNLTDDLYRDGCLYVYNTTLAEGTHFNYFMCHDGLESVLLPSTGNFSGPSVTPIEDAPPIPSFSIPILIISLIGVFLLLGRIPLDRRSRSQKKKVFGAYLPHNSSAKSGRSKSKRSSFVGMPSSLQRRIS